MYTREESFYGLPRPLRADIQLWIHLVRTYIECNYFNFIAAIEKENFLLNKSPGTLPRLLFFVFLYPIVFYVIFSAFFEFVVLAVYVAARNFWHIEPFLSYCMCTIVCVPGSLPFPARRQMLSFTICRIFYPKKHKCRCIQQRHLNKERNFFGGESVLCIGKISLPHFLYTVYQIFRCTQIFVGFFDGNKKAPCGAFSNTETFFFCALSYVLQGICLGVNHFSSIHLWY